MRPTKGGSKKLGIARAATNGQPKKGTSHENKRVGDSSDLAVIKVTKGPTPTFALSCDLGLCLAGLNPADHGGHTFGTTLGDCILKCTYIRDLVPSLITS